MTSKKHNKIRNTHIDKQEIRKTNKNKDEASAIFTRTLGLGQTSEILQMVRLLRFPLLLTTFLSTQGQQGRHDYPGVTWGAAGAREIREKAEVVFFL